MELDWSEQSPHIRTLFRPWQPGDGYDEATIQAAEARLGVRLSATLRNFYQAWGRRRDVTRLGDPLLSPDELKLRDETLLFWVENQGVFYWGVPCEALGEADPPVVVTEGGPVLHWIPSQVCLSRFLDALTYNHAFCQGGAPHGGWADTPFLVLPSHHLAWLEAQWSKVTFRPIVFGLVPDPDQYPWVTLYGRDGQALTSFDGYVMVAAREAESLDEIAQVLQITWSKRW